MVRAQIRPLCSKFTALYSGLLSNSPETSAQQAMNFTVLTLLDGEITGRESCDTEYLDQASLAHCTAMLRRLRAGELTVAFRTETGASIIVSLGAPPFLAKILGQLLDAPGCFFCLSEPDRPSFQCCFVAPEIERGEIDHRAAITIHTLSKAGRPYHNVEPAPDHETAINREIFRQSTFIIGAAPVVVHAPTWLYEVDPAVALSTVGLTRDFGAALLLES